MTDGQIKEYLEAHNYSVLAQDAIIHIINRSYQIIDTYYDYKASKMTIRTPKNTFTFDWILGNGVATH